jgi:hypothetical protein
MVRISARSGEPDQRVVAAGLGVDALRVRFRRIAGQLDLGPENPEGLGVGAADGSPAAFGYRRASDLLLPEFDDPGHVLAQLGIEGLDIRRVADEIG